MTTNTDHGQKMSRFRNYWAYSVGLAIAWAVVLVIVRVFGGRKKAQNLLFVLYGFGICWVSETIARYVYPPPKRWISNRPE